MRVVYPSKCRQEDCVSNAFSVANVKLRDESSTFDNVKKEELDSPKNNRTWSLVEKSHNQKLDSCKWICEKKLKIESSIRLKARIMNRPNLAYDFSSLSRYVVDPSRDRWEALKKSSKKLKGTRNLKILIKRHKRLSGDPLGSYVDSGFNQVVKIKFEDNIADMLTKAVNSLNQLSSMFWLIISSVDSMT